MYTLILEERTDYLYVKVECEYADFEIMSQYWHEICDIAVKRKTRRVLVDMAIADSPSMSDLFQLATTISENLQARKIRFAVFDRFEAQWEVNQFAEMAATNRGLDARAFKDIEAAEKWLRLP